MPNGYGGFGLPRYVMQTEDSHDNYLHNYSDQQAGEEQQQLGYGDQHLQHQSHPPSDAGAAAVVIN